MPHKVKPTMFYTNLVRQLARRRSTRSIIKSMESIKLTTIIITIMITNMITNMSITLMSMNTIAKINNRSNLNKYKYSRTKNKVISMYPNNHLYKWINIIIRVAKCLNTNTIIITLMKVKKEMSIMNIIITMSMEPPVIMITAMRRMNMTTIITRTNISHIIMRKVEMYTNQLISPQAAQVLFKREPIKRLNRKKIPTILNGQPKFRLALYKPRLYMRIIRKLQRAF